MRASTSGGAPHAATRVRAAKDRHERRARCIGKSGSKRGRNQPHALPYAALVPAAGIASFPPWKRARGRQAHPPSWHTTAHATERGAHREGGTPPESPAILAERAALIA